MKKVNFLSISLTAFAILFFATTGFAQEQDKTQEELESSAAALAKKSQNPVGNMISAPIEYWHYGNIDNSNGANVIMLKPVYPVTFGKFTLINRLII
ncbi:MAG: hypothetical protein KAG99_05890, partial [Bacteroidales bacterium]|nr:hypothetical protein [Bacteroidales bacterium]